jgi:hypothetical protein
MQTKIKSIPNTLHKLKTYQTISKPAQFTDKSSGTSNTLNNNTDTRILIHRSSAKNQNLPIEQARIHSVLHQFNTHDQ